MNTRLPLFKMMTFGLLPGFVKKMFYRLRGNKIGRHVKIHFGAVVISKEKFAIGDDTELGFFTSISGHTISIGKGCNLRSAVILNAYTIHIGDDVTISETAIIRASHLSVKSELIIDDLVHIFPHTMIDPSRQVHLCEECAVGPGCSIFTHGSYKNILEGYPVVYGDVRIGCRVELTYNVFVAPGITIGDDAIVAYGSYVNKDLPAGIMAAGCPAVVKRTKEQYAPTPSEEEKRGIVRQIVSEFEQYMILCGKQIDSDRIKVVESKEVIVDGSCHFDLVSYRCSNTDTMLSKEMRRFFSRYGIRFRVGL